MTQKLLGKIDKELESHKTSKQIDSPKFLELINKVNNVVLFI